MLSDELTPRDKYLWAHFLNLTSRPGSKHTANSGWYSEMARQLTSPVSAYMQTVAGIVDQLRAMNGHVAFISDRIAYAENALLAFYDRLNAPATFDALDQLESSPRDTERIMTRFLAYSLQRSSPDLAQKITGLLRRFMKIPYSDTSILNGAGRIFHWIERDRKIELRCIPARSQLLESWTGQAIAIKGQNGPLDGHKAEINITRFRDFAMHMESFAWEISAKNLILAGGFEPTLEEAAEKCYRAWYMHHTRLLFVAARQPSSWKKVVVIGNTVSAQEFKASQAKFWSIIVNTEDREPDYFVLNWPSVIKEKRIFEVRRTNEKEVELQGGTKLPMSDLNMHFYVYRPEEAVEDEVVCCKCKTLSTVAGILMKYVDGYGPTCGPCIDFLAEHGELSLAAFD